MNWREFKPTIYFLGKFLAIYLAGNLLYGLFVTSYYPVADPVTKAITRQSAWCLSETGWKTDVVDRTTRATSAIMYNNKSIVTVYEGCNGVNVAIVFLAFIIAFGPNSKSLLWFIPISLMLIYAFNVIRIYLLFIVTIKLPDYLYFSHKYLFTAFIYSFVFILWMAWVKYFSISEKHGK